MTSGRSKWEGVLELAEEGFYLPVRLGLREHVPGLGDVVRNPIHATGVGLLLFGGQGGYAKGSDVASSGSSKGVWERMKSWFKGNL